MFARSAGEREPITIGRVTLRCEWEGPALLFIGARVKGSGLALGSGRSNKKVSRTVGTPNNRLDLTRVHLRSVRCSQASLLGNRTPIPPLVYDAEKVQHLRNSHACRSACLGVGVGWGNQPPGSKGTIRAHVLSHALSEEEGRGAAAFTASERRLPGPKFIWA